MAIGSEIHNDLFDCSDNLCTPAPVPEPGSLTLLAALLLASCAVLRRRCREGCCFLLAKAVAK